MENMKTIKMVVSDDTCKSETVLTNDGFNCTVGNVKKNMKLKIFEGGKAPEYKNGNWMDTYVREVGRLEKAHIHGEFTIKDPMIEWFNDGAVRFNEGDVIICKLGFALELLPKHELWLVPRSSTFRKTGLILTNSKGIGDDTFIGDGDEYSVMMLATRDNAISVGDRLVQIRVAEAMGDKYSFEVVDTLGNANRGGFGTTGK